ncbi:hypothetical protein LshimejAT787_1402430 [Lyophyllum shimeji]|uniref:Uncharacterized protein n=1 Tax=Lyophyllum shimeji TaxID=47721 RepID=A0A9P3PY45_LYOSH|nr:hypothetical protein LshimejAT787_1402430 [Lyophyllum shimeji]
MARLDSRDLRALFRRIVQLDELVERALALSAGEDKPSSSTGTSESLSRSPACSSNIEDTLDPALGPV